MFPDYYRRTWEDTAGDISPQQTAHATALRVPILSTGSPHWNYITGIVVSDNIVDHGIMPTEDEVAEVAAYLTGYKDRWLNESFQNAMTHFAPYDIDGSANAGYFMKRPDGRWCYHCRTWRNGPRWWNHGDGSLSLCIAHNLGNATLQHGNWVITAGRTR